MIALSQKSRRVVVTIDSDRVRGFIELKAAMQLHYPVAALWRLDQGLQGPQLTAVLQPTTASATEGGSGQETHPSQTRSEALPAHRSSNAASASAAPQAVEMNPERPATVTEAELDMLLGRSEPSPGPTT
jgi:hypothetical protein